MIPSRIWWIASIRSPLIANQAMPATLGGTEKMASVGMTGSGIVSVATRRASTTAAMTAQKKTPIPSAMTASVVAPTCASPIAPMSPPATMVKKNPG